MPYDIVLDTTGTTYARQQPIYIEREKKRKTKKEKKEKRKKKRDKKKKKKC